MASDSEDSDGSFIDPGVDKGANAFKEETKAEEVPVVTVEYREGAFDAVFKSPEAADKVLKDLRSSRKSISRYGNRLFNRPFEGVISMFCYKKPDLESEKTVASFDASFGTGICGIQACLSGINLIGKEYMYNEHLDNFFSKLHGKSFGVQEEREMFVFHG